MKFCVPAIALMLTLTGIVHAQVLPITNRNVSYQANNPEVPAYEVRNTGCDGNGIGAGCDSGSWGNDRGCGLGDSKCGNNGCDCGAYHSFFGGLSIPQNLNFDGGALDGLDLGLKDGWVTGHATGRQLNSCWRGEIETSFRNNSAGVLDRSGVPISGDMAGKMNIYSGMFNLARDFGGRNCKSTRPYAGAGVGFAFIDLEASDPAVGFIDSRDSAFAYQAFVGISRSLRDGVDLFTEYRVYGTHDFCVDFTNPNGGMSSSSTTFLSHNFMFGVRIWTR